MCPGLVVSGDEIGALGSGGSNRIRTAMLQVLSRRLLIGQSWQNAVSADRMHYENHKLVCEAGSAAGRECADAFESGQTHVARFPTKNMYFGGVHCAISIGGEPSGIGDTRRSGAVQRG